MGNAFFIKDCDPTFSCEKQVELECKDLRDNYGVQDWFDMSISPLVYSAIILSWVVSTAMAAIIHFNKELHVHPYGHYKVICVVQSIFFSLIVTCPKTCDLRLPELFQWTMLWSPMLHNSESWNGTNGLYLATQVLNGSQTFLVSLTWYSMFFINIKICLSLAEQLRRPFKVPGSWTRV